MATQDSAGVSIRSATAGDAAAVAGIYNPYIAKTIITFEEEPVDAGEIARRIADVHAKSLPWLIAESGGAVVGYAYATRWQPRCAYRSSAEVTVYLASDQGGRGIGSMLYTQLLAILRKCDVHAVIGGIALPNDASVALHEKFGFKKIAHFEEVGFKFNRWIDVGYWQRIL
jgi:phosphinothricin acetyltransferase